MAPLANRCVGVGNRWGRDGAPSRYRKTFKRSEADAERAARKAANHQGIGRPSNVPRTRGQPPAWSTWTPSRYRKTFKRSESHARDVLLAIEAAIKVSEDLQTFRDQHARQASSAGIHHQGIGRPSNVPSWRRGTALTATSTHQGIGRPSNVPSRSTWSGSGSSLSAIKVSEDLQTFRAGPIAQALGRA